MIALAEETLRIGKRVAHGGRGRVRSCTVETPVEEQVQLREETVRDTVRRTDVDETSAGNDPRKGKAAA